jgi:tetratricopeptide (TPR) repeat protein
MRTHLLAAVVGLLFCGGAAAAILGNEASQTILREGTVAEAKGEYQLAAEKYAAAAKADPAASGALSALAGLYLDHATARNPNAEKMRQQARFLAKGALAIDARDPVAQEVLRKLDDATPPPLHEANPAATALMNEGEQLFTTAKYDEALAKYLAAAAADPQLSTAWVYAGDCFFARKRYPEAEQHFRKGAEVEPLNSQAWRFLSDALLLQKKPQEAIDALLQGIGAHPSQLPNWEKLNAIGAQNGLPLKPLKLVRKGSTTRDPATGKFTVNVDPATMANKPDGSFWLMLSMAEVARLSAPPLPDQGAASSPFARELADWRNAFKAAAALEAKSGELLADPALSTLQMLYRENQLEAGLLLLTYKESWRADLEAWKKAHPDGVARFIKSYGLRP